MENKLLRDFIAIHRKEVRPRVKHHIIYRHRTEYPVTVMCKFFEYPGADITPLSTA